MHGRKSVAITRVREYKNTWDGVEKELLHTWRDRSREGVELRTGSGNKDDFGYSETATVGLTQAPDITGSH